MRRAVSITQQIKMQLTPLHAPDPYRSRPRGPRASWRTRTLREKHIQSQTRTAQLTDTQRPTHTTRTALYTVAAESRPPVVIR